MKYGLGALPAKLEDLDSKKKNGKEYGLGTRDHKILSRLGICRSITREWRYLPPSFGRMGLHNLTAEATTASLNLFLQHYGTDTLLGIYLSTSIENLQLELGVSKCPFKYDYEVWNVLATDSWVKRCGSASINLAYPWSSTTIVWSQPGRAINASCNGW